MSKHDNECKCVFCRDQNPTDLSVLQIGQNDREYFEAVNQEIQSIAGTKMAYYPLVPASQQPNFDPLYRESRGRVYYSPFILSGFYQQEVPEIELTQYGIDSKRETSIQLNMSSLIDTITEATGGAITQPKVGDLILVYHFPNNLYEIRNVFAGDGMALQPLQFKIFGNRYQRSTSDITLIDRENQPEELKVPFKDDLTNDDILT